MTRQFRIRYALDQVGFGLFVAFLVVLPFAMSFGIWTTPEIGGPTARTSLILFSWVVYGAILRTILFSPTERVPMPKPIHEELGAIGASAPEGTWDKHYAGQVGEYVESMVRDGLTGHKAASICQDRGFRVSGVVLQNEAGERCIVELSAVRWMSKHDIWTLMHPCD